MVLGQFLSKGGIVLKEEVGVADTNPEELWFGSKQSLANFLSKLS